MKIQTLAAASSEAYAQSTICDRATDTQVLIQNVRGAAVVAFRGTNDFRKVIGDLEVNLVPFSQQLKLGKWHEGVGRAVNGIMDALVSALKGFPTGAPIYLTGHSFGGGCAPAAAYLLSAAGFNVQGVVTFAGMRFCDRLFSWHYWKRTKFPTYRVVAEYDVVPHLPIPALFFLYRHVGQEIYISTGLDGLSNEEVQIGAGKTQSFLSIFDEFFWGSIDDVVREDGKLGGFELEMHSIARYCQLVNKTSFMFETIHLNL